MIEIRPIQAGEAQRFLELMCRIFDLELDRAENVFYTEPMFDLKRKWALFENGELVSILTTVPLVFGWGRAMGIAGVGTRADRQGNGFASLLLETVLAHGVNRGEPVAYLFANRPGVYAKNGFTVVDRVVRGQIVRSEEHYVPPAWEFEAVQARYAEWASQHPDRLRRDHQRWQFWQWNFRVSTALGDGYVCIDGGIVREMVSGHPMPEPWILPPSVEWVGLESMTDAIEVPLVSVSSDLLLMARGIDRAPQMFMTDQF